MAKFHVACPITGQAVCFCDSLGGLGDKLGRALNKNGGAGPLTAGAVAQMWKFWKRLADGQPLEPPAAVEVLVPRLYRYQRKQEDLTVDGITKDEALESLKMAELEAQQAALKAAKAFALVGKTYVPPQGVMLPAGLLEVKEADSVESLQQLVAALQEDLNALEVQESREAQQRSAQQQQQAQQLKGAVERKQLAEQQYEEHRMELERREAERREGERREKERREAELRAEADRQKEMERQRLEAEQRVEAERRAEVARREAERREAERREAERRAEMDRQQHKLEVERREREKERQKKMAEAERARNELERREAEGRRQKEAAEEARRAREAEAAAQTKASERRRKTTAAETLANLLADDDDWMREDDGDEDAADDDDEEFMPGTTRTRQRKPTGSNRNNPNSSNSNSAFRALEKLADSSLLVSPREPLGTDATLLRLPGGMSDDEFGDDLPSPGVRHSSEEDSPLVPPGGGGMRSTKQPPGKAAKGGAASNRPGSKQAAGPKKAGGTSSSTQDSRERGGTGSASQAMNRVVSTIPHKEKDAALQALRSVTKMAPGRGAMTSGANNPLGKVIPTKPRDRTHQPPSAKGPGGARVGQTGADKAGSGRVGEGPPRGAGPPADKPGRPGPAAPSRNPPPAAPTKPAPNPPRAATAPSKPSKPSAKPAANVPPTKGPPGGGASRDKLAAKARAQKGKSLLKERDFGPELTGKTLMLLWPDDLTWWKALVLHVDTKAKSALVYYDTGEEETLNLMTSIMEREVAWLADGDSPVPPPSNGTPEPPAPPPHTLPPAKHSAPPPALQRAQPPVKVDPSGRKRKVPPSNPHRPNTHAGGPAPPPEKDDPRHKKSRIAHDLLPHSTKPTAKPPGKDRADTKSTVQSKPTGGSNASGLDSVKSILHMGNRAVGRMVEVYWDDEDIWFRGQILSANNGVLTVEYLHGVVDELYDDVDVRIKLLEKQTAG